VYINGTYQHNLKKGYQSKCNEPPFDLVHEMAKDEARHGKAFEGLLNRYFK